MAPYTRCLRREDYTVGWIAALPLELQAAMKQLDEEDCPLPQEPGDPLSYVLGRIGPHNVALACLPAGQTGLSSAAMVATRMKTRFPHLRFGLLVGIGGGVSSQSQDVRLGDVVVSQPNQGEGGVIQYDLGKNTTSGFKRTGSLNAPPDILLSTLATYQARNLDPGGPSISHRFKPGVPNQDLLNYPGPDLLFDASYEHIEGEACDSCDKKYLIESKRQSFYPMVHYGTIASGNQVIKNGRTRDQLSMELEGVLCFEMEAAGIMNTFPCLVIRGICDYADSHKAKFWQPYAALVAATYARDLLSGVVPSDASASLQSSKALVKHTEKSSKSWVKRRVLSTSYQNNEIADHHSFLAYNISDYDYVQTHWEFTHLRCPGTTHWILEDPRYIEWCGGKDSRCLWLTGSIGSGKSLITSTIIESLLERPKTDLVLHFFFRYAYTDELNATTLVNSCIKQIFDRLGENALEHHNSIKFLFQQIYGRKSKIRSFEEILERVFKPLVDGLDEHITLVVDGLDECEDKEISKALKLIRYMLQKPSIKVLISGRESLNVRSLGGKYISIHISRAEVANDILNFIQWSVEEKMQERKITNDPKILAHIRTALFEKADSSILWASMQISSIWEDCYTDAEIMSALSRLPKDLNETYGRCIDKIDSLQGLYSRDFAAKIFPWILSAVRPFTLVQLQQAFAINTITGVFDKLQVPAGEDILGSCANLIIKDSGQRISFAHHSIRQYLERPDPTRPFFERSSIANQNLPLLRVILLHLTSSDYTLEIQKIEQTALCLQEEDFEQLVAGIPRWIRRWMPRPKAVQLRLPHIPSEIDNAMQPPEFFFLAREQWTDLTRDIKSEDLLYEQFCDLVLSRSELWRMHPWKSIGQSNESHKYSMLGWSIANNHKPIFELLFVDRQLNLRVETLQIPFQQYGNMSSLLLAVRNDATWAIDTIRKHYPNLDLKAYFSSKDANNWNALHHAADAGSRGMIEELYFNIGVPIAEDLDGANPLEIATLSGHTPTAIALLTIPRTRTPRALSRAVRNSIRCGTLDLLKLSSEYWSGGYIPLFHEEDVLTALNAGHSSIVAFLLSQMVEISYKSQLKILLYTVETNDMELMKISTRVLPRQSKDSVKETLQKAVQMDNFQMTQLFVSSLLIHEEDLSVCMKLAFCEAIKAGHIQLVEKLIAIGLNIYQIEYLRAGTKSPLKEAIQDRNEAMVRFLLNHSVNPNHFLNLEPRPLSLALDIGMTSITKLLLEYGADPCRDNPFDPSAIHQAASSASIPSTVLELLMTYANDGWDGQYGRQTPLISAAILGDVAKVKLLIGMPPVYPATVVLYEAYIDQKGRDSQSALQMCQRLSHEECAHIIAQARESAIKDGKILQWRRSKVDFKRFTLTKMNVRISKSSYSTYGI